MTIEERANQKDHIYVKLKRLSVTAKEVASELDKCSPAQTNNFMLGAVLDEIVRVGSLGQEIRNMALELIDDKAATD